MARNTGRGSPATKPHTTITNPRAAMWIKPHGRPGRFTQAKSDGGAFGGAFGRRRWWHRLLRRCA